MSECQELVEYFYETQLKHRWSVGGPLRHLNKKIPMP